MPASQKDSAAVVVTLPRLGANDDEARLVGWLAQAGDRVGAGQAICEVETTKAVAEVTSPQAGYLTPIADVEATLPVNAPLAIVSPEPDVDRNAILAAHRSAHAENEGPRTAGAVEPGARRATRKAELLARRHGVDLSTIIPSEADGVIREHDVDRARIEATEAAPAPAHVGTAPSVSRILVVGSVLGGGAAIVVDILLRSGASLPVAIVDRDASTHGKRVLGVPVEGTSDIGNIESLFNTGRFDAAIIAFNGNLRDRAAAFEALDRAGIPIANAVDSRAEIRSGVRIGRGNVVAAGSYLGPEARLGDNNFLSSRTTIEHHCVVGSHCGFGPSVTFSGRVRVGDLVRFGTMVAVEPDVTIGNGAVIASSCVLTTDVEEGSIVKAVVSHRTTSAR